MPVQNRRGNGTPIDIAWGAGGMLLGSGAGFIPFAWTRPGPSLMPPPPPPDMPPPPPPVPQVTPVRMTGT